MGTMNVITMVRKCERGVTITEEAVEPAMIVAGPVLKESYDEFQGWNSDVGLLSTAEKKARKERNEASARFEKDYDGTRSTIKLRMPYADVPRRASVLATQDDVINSSKSMVTLLANEAGVDETHPLDGEGDAAPTGDAWALTLARYFIPQVQSTAAAFRRAFVAAEVLKKAVEQRAEKRTALEANFLAFRRVVRDVHGSKSRQYQSIRDRSEPENGAEENPPAPEPAPAPAMVA